MATPLCIARCIRQKLCFVAIERYVAAGTTFPHETVNSARFSEGTITGKKNPARITEIVRTFDPERIFFFPTFSCVNRCARIFFFFKNDLTIIVTLPLNYFIVQQRVAACVQLPTGNELFDAVFSPLHV